MFQMFQTTCYNYTAICHIIFYSTEVRLFCHQRSYIICEAWEELPPRRIVTKTKITLKLLWVCRNFFLKDGAFYLPCSKCTLQYMAYKWNQYEQRQGKCNKARFHKGHIDRTLATSYHILMSHIFQIIAYWDVNF